MTRYSIQHLPVEERPRERLMRTGAESLSTTELIAIILGSGSKTKPVLELAHEIMGRFGSLRQLAEASLAELLEIKGIGLAKGIQLKAAFNLGMRASNRLLVRSIRSNTLLMPIISSKKSSSMRKGSFLSSFCKMSKGSSSAMKWSPSGAYLKHSSIRGKFFIPPSGTRRQV